MNRLPVPVNELAGPGPNLQTEIDELRQSLQTTNTQLALERTLARDVHEARGRVIAESGVLRRVFAFDDADADAAGQGETVTTNTLLSAAFGKAAPDASLPDGFVRTVSRELRAATHPDAGGDTKIAQEVSGRLAVVDDDPAFAVAGALLAIGKPDAADTKAARIQRYRLHLALAGQQPLFESSQEAVSTAEKEIDGAAWRVRAQAAFKSLDLITGGNQTWVEFLQEIVATQRMFLVEMVNRVQPQLLALQERIAKGDPIPAGKLDTAAIDAVLEQIWSTIGNKERQSSYNPPYQNWLEILLPAMEKLDPGEKPGEQYTRFAPPIAVVPRSSYYEDYGGISGGRHKRPYNPESMYPYSPKTSMYDPFGKEGSEYGRYEA